MSYMGLPRFTFAGSFYTDPSTMDNDPAHYEDSCTNPAPWQDPGGSHFFTFQDMLAGTFPNRDFTPPAVTAVIDENGNPILTDPLVGAAVNSMDTPGGIPGLALSPAKMVDLDVYQQAVSGIHGFFLKLSFKSAITATTTLVGAMDATFLNSCRFDRVLPTRGWAPWDSYGAGSFGGDTNASGVYQSVIRVPASTWPQNSGSPVLDQLRTKCSTDSAGNLLLSMRMTLDGYQNVAYHHEDFRIGRIVSTVGPLLAGEPSQCIPGRWLNGRPYNGGTQANGYQDADPWNQPSLYGAPFIISQRASGPVVTVDLSNAIMTSSPGAAPLDLGNLSLYIGDGSTGVVGAPFQLDDIFYSLAGGIVDLPLSSAQAVAAASQPFFLVSSRTDIVGFPPPFNNQPILWQESPTGTWIACNDRNLQLASDQPNPPAQTALVYATQWGEPIASASAIDFGVYPCFPNNSIATVPWSAGYAGNSPNSEGALGATLAMLQPGEFQMTFQALRDPGQRTTELDSQLYFVAFWPAAGLAPPPNLNPASVPPPPPPVPPQEQIISCVLWQSYPANPNPQFSEVVQIMKVYDKLFPSMHAKMDLTDEQTFFTFSVNPPWQFYYAGTPGPMQYGLPNGGSISAGAIPYYLTRETDDPRFMPIMRNLSPGKLLTVLYYCWNLQQGVQPTPDPPGTYGAIYAREHAGQLPPPGTNPHASPGANPHASTPNPHPGAKP